MSPTAASRPCLSPGCSALVKNGYCTDHRRERPKDPDQARFYASTRWKKLRAIIRARDPICKLCEVRPSQNVDHISGEWRDNRPENLRGLCNDCERSHTARQHQAKQQRGGGLPD
jgi:5-methylcytosine-specific restriction protein A